MEVTSSDDQQQIESAQEYKPGELAPVIITQKKVWKPDDLKKEDITGTIKSLLDACENTDEAARRFSVLEVWQNRHMDRGYQYLEDNGKGGWNIIGADGGKTKNGLAAGDDMGLYPTNILSAQGDISTSALCRGEIRVNFSPNKSKNPQDVACADESNKYKHVWAKSNKSINLQRNIMGLGWTDPRVLAWTKTIADIRFGLNDDGSPRQREISTVHGVLETKLPMMVDTLEECGYAQIFEEMDYAVARAAYPWMGDKIKPSWGTAGELEFERIARINTRIGIVGKYITGTSGLREATMCYTWLRPGMFFDDSVKAEKRESLLKNFPTGMLVVRAGQEIVCVWDESMDDHLDLGMYTRGFGQNRRSLGSSDVPLQKRINIWADLWDKFVRGAIPFIALDSEAYNTEAIAELEASPKRFIPVAPGENQTIQDTFAASPQVVPIPGMIEAFQFYVGPLIQSIDGMTPALMGEGEGQDNTVGATQIRLQQALERIGTAWIMANLLFAGMVSKAVKCCAENGNSEIFDSVDGVGDVSVNPENLKGNANCHAETINGIPESGAQREAKVLQILDMAKADQNIASLIATPSNAREIVKALHIDNVITIDEANSEDGALEDIERLLDSEPLLNPDWQKLLQAVEQLNTVHEQAKAAATQAVQGGDPLSPEILQKGQQMEQQLGQMQQQLQKTPQFLPSITVPQDESLDYATITATVFAWMQEPDGRNLRRAAAKEQQGGKNWGKWTNIMLYWQANKDMAAKVAATKAQAPPPKVNLTGKLSPEQQAQLLQMQAGIQTTPEQLNAPHEEEQEVRLYTPVSEITQKTKRKRL